MKKLYSLTPKPENCIIHLETFFANQSIIFNEDTIRFAGGKILSTINREFNPNLLAECDIPFKIDKDCEWRKPRGFVLFTPKPGISQEMPSKISNNDIDKYIVQANAGNTFTTTNSLVFSVVSVKLQGDINDLLEKNSDIEEWFNQKINYISVP